MNHKYLLKGNHDNEIFMKNWSETLIYRGSGPNAFSKFNLRIIKQTLEYSFFHFL